MTHGRRKASDEEQDLLRRSRTLDEAALRAVFDAYYDPLYRYIYRHLRHEQSSEDVTAEVFRSFLEQLNLGRGPTSYLKAWLYQVAHNLVVDELRRAKYRDHVPLNEEMQIPALQVGRQEENASAQQAINLALQSLTEKQRDVLILKFLHNLENEEIAYTLKMTVGTVKALQYRGLQAMRRHLTRQKGFEPNDP